jgi:methylated-DNA-protein-cysteine methyltransferase-like protein
MNRPAVPGPADREAPDGPPRPLDEAVAAVLGATGPGDVLTYGEVAAEAGRPGAARAVGRILSRGGDGLAWWRVVTASGRLVPGHEDTQTRLLRAEGVAVERGRVVASPRSPGRRRRAGPSTS